MQHRYLERYLELIIIGPNDPQILAAYEWDTEKAKEYLNNKIQETGLPLTLTHVVGYCAGRALKNQPDINGRICFGNVRVGLFLVLS